MANEIIVELNGSQYKLLSSLVDELYSDDTSLASRIKKLSKTEGYYELTLGVEELSTMCEAIADVANQEEDARKQNKIFDLVDYLEDVLYENTEEVEDEEDWDDDDEEWDDADEDEWDDEE